MTRLRAGDPGDLWVVAARQTGGRGRHGRSWQSPPGNLYASLALRLELAPALAPQLGFVAGVSLYEALRPRLPDCADLRIKWPNDLIIGGAKVAGLLLESAILPGSQLACVVGFGVNCRSHPQDLAYRATDLAAAGDPVPDALDLLDALAAAMARQCRLWNQGLHFAKIRSSWLDASVAVGTRLTVALPNRRVEGDFGGIDSAGRLLLVSGGAVLTIEAGDVFLPELAARDGQRSTNEDLPSGV